MTVRNVRAYSTRGLIDPPRLEGRTGYYNQDHLQRLLLIRTLLGRGFTLAAVEDAILKSPTTAPNVALDLINIFETSEDHDPSEVIARDDLVAMAGLDRGHPLLDVLSELGLLELLDEDTVRMTNAGIVRPGAMAVSMGLTTESVADIVPAMREHLEAISDRFVEHVDADITQPFLEAGLPQDQWPQVFEKLEALIPIGAQVVMAMFRATLRETIEIKIGHKLEALAADQPHSVQPHSASG